MRTSKNVALVLTAATVLVGLGAVTSPAMAADTEQVVATVDQATAPALGTYYGNSVVYGYVSSASTCGVVTAGYCAIKFTNTSTVARPSEFGLVKYCGKWGIVDGTTIEEAIASGKLVNRYVAVLWGGTGAQGALNCH